MMMGVVIFLFESLFVVLQSVIGYKLIDITSRMHIYVKYLQFTRPNAHWGAFSLLWGWAFSLPITIDCTAAPVVECNYENEGKHFV